MIVIEILEIEAKLIEGERVSKKLPSPSDFDNGLISGNDIENLIPLLMLPFDNSIINYGSNNGFKRKGISIDICINRLQQVFGYTHVQWHHKLIDSQNINNGYYTKIYIHVSIGNYIPYVDINSNVPSSRFVELYSIDGIGRGFNSIDPITSEKNAVSNGLKDALRKTGLLRYLYIDNDDNDDDTDVTNTFATKVQLKEPIKVNPNGNIILKARAIDLSNNNDIDVILYKENKSNPSHNKVIDLILSFKNELYKDKIINITFIKSRYENRVQYIIQNLLRKEE